MGQDRRRRIARHGAGADLLTGGAALSRQRADGGRGEGMSRRRAFSCVLFSGVGMAVIPVESGATQAAVRADVQLRVAQRNMTGLVLAVLGRAMDDAKPSYLVRLKEFWWW